LQHIDDRRIELSYDEELLLHNLLTRKYWTEKKKKEDAEPGVRDEHSKREIDIPVKWEMLRGVHLEPWQEDVVATYLGTICKKDEVNKAKGTIKLPTGTGKTIIALAIIERLQEMDPNLRVAIVVPTIVLMEQWLDEVTKRSNIPISMVGRLGGSYQDSFSNEKRILISVINSAREKLPGLVDESTAEHLLLIVDECHRAAGEVMAKIFKTGRVYSLGLSATPEPDTPLDDADYEMVDGLNYDQTILGKELGPIIYEMNINDAYSKGILPQFEIRHYALPLNNDEKRDYERLSRRIQELNEQLNAGKNRGRGGHFMANVMSMASRDGEEGAIAREFIAKTTARKRLLYKAEARHMAVKKILEERFAKNPYTKAILFHESIDEAMEIYADLLKAGYKAVAENSQLSKELRSSAMELFRNDTAQVMVSVKSLIEGLNVPKADIGIIVASSTSIRSRIQSIGRVLRRPRDEGTEKRAVIYTLYIDKTSDEEIYAKADWDKLIGTEHNRYFRWDLQNAPEESEGPPRQVKPRETQINEDDLVVGEPYPGEYEGQELSCDHMGNVYDSKGRIARNVPGLADKIKKFKGTYGRFKVTPIKRFVLVLKKLDDEWTPIYVTTLKETVSFESDEMLSAFDATVAKPGDEFPTSLTGKKDQEYKFGRSQGRYYIMKKQKSGNTIFAKAGEEARDSEKGENAQKLLNAYFTLTKKGHTINKFRISECGYAYYVMNGKTYYLATVKSGLEFPSEL